MKIDETTVRIIKSDLESGDHGNTVLLAGDPGIGKTSLCKSIAQMWDSKAFIVSVNLLADKADLTGARLVKSADGTTMEQRFFAHHKISEAVQYANDNPGKSVLLVLDEINRSTPDVTSGALSITTERELGNSKLPDNLFVMATGNVKGNVTALDSASLSRFVIYNVEADALTLLNYLDSRDNGQRPTNRWVKSVLTLHPHCVYQVSRPESYTLIDNPDDDDDDAESVQAGFADLLDAGEEMLQLTTPRTIEGISNWLDTISDNGQDLSLLKELFSTTVEIGSRETNQLTEIIEAHVGNTDFSIYLTQEIGQALMASQSTPTAVSTGIPGKPRSWNALKSAPTISAMEDLVAKLDDNDKADVLLYALFDNDNNQVVLEQILAAMTTMERDHVAKLSELFKNSYINDHNKEAAIAIAGSPIASKIADFDRLFN